jgi:hypothetical protein
MTSLQLTPTQIEDLTRISNQDHYACFWRKANSIMCWMEDLADLGLIKFICEIENFRFKLEITQAGLDALKQAEDQAQDQLETMKKAFTENQFFVIKELLEWSEITDYTLNTMAREMNTDYESILNIIKSINDKMKDLIQLEESFNGAFFISIDTLKLSDALNNLFETQAVHHCIIQQSSNTILVVGETAQEAITEYNETYNESLTVNDFGTSLNSENDVVLMKCTEFLFDKAQGGEELDYFDNGFNVIDAYITETEDFDLADTCLSTQYDEGSHHTYFDSNVYPVFNLKSTLLEIAEDYETPLSYDDVSDISGEIEDHFENEETQDFDEVVFANCTNSNQYPEGKFMLDGEEHYTLSFIHSDLVLILKRGCIIR